MTALIPSSALPQKSKRAPTARDIKARGKREAKRSASPLVSTPTKGLGLKGRNTHRITPFQGWVSLIRVPGATRCACPWLSYSAPSALHYLYARLFQAKPLCVNVRFGSSDPALTNKGTERRSHSVCRGQVTHQIAHRQV